MTEETPPPGANAEGPSVEDSCKAWKIILLILGLLLCGTMFIFGMATLNTCPTNPNLPVIILVQGIFLIGMSTVFLFKFYVNATREKISDITFHVIFGLSYVASVCCLISCTRFLDISGCKEEDVYKGGIFFVVIPWLAVIAIPIGLIIYRCSTKNDVEPIT